MNKGDKVYLVYKKDTDGYGYYNQFDNLEDAADEAESLGEEVFEAQPKNLGYPKTTTKVTFTKRKSNE